MGMLKTHRQTWVQIPSFAFTLKMVEDNYEKDETINPCENCSHNNIYGSDKCKFCKHAGKHIITKWWTPK